MTVRLVLALLLPAAAPCAWAKTCSVTAGPDDALRFDTDGISFPGHRDVMNGRLVSG